MKGIEDEFSELIQKNSTTQRPNTFLQSSFDAFEHLQPMLSLDNVFSPEELTAWGIKVGKLADLSKTELVVEPKMDGLAISLIYVDGKLLKAGTHFCEHTSSRIRPRDNDSTNSEQRILLITLCI